MTTAAEFGTRETQLHQHVIREREREIASLPFLEGIQLHPHESLLYNHMAICFTAIGTGAKFNSNNSSVTDIPPHYPVHSTQEPQTDNLVISQYL